MTVFDTEPIQLLFELAHKNKINKDEVYNQIANTPLWNMFEMFDVENNEGLLYLSRIFDKSPQSYKLSSDGSYFVSYVHKIMDKEMEISRFLQELVKNENDIVNEAINRASEYLPKNVSFSDLKLFFIPVPYDSRISYMQNKLVIYFDPFLALDIGKDGFVKYLAHEVHHIGRSKINGNIARDIKDINGLIFFIFRRLEMEGIADCVFDISLLPQFKKLRREREKLFNNYSKHFGKIQNILLKMIDRKMSFEQGLDKFKTILFMIHNEYHPLGHRLASEIEKNLERETLIGCVGDPVRFIESYQTVASQNNLFKFDQKILKEVH